MLFNTIEYGLFLPIVFILHWKTPHKFRWFILLISSYYFYMSWNAKYVFLILFTTLISFIAGILIEEYQKYKKSILILTLVSCLGVLFVFKYFNFFFEIINGIFSIFSLPVSDFTLKLLLPVGISFYTFQTLSYVIDIYRGNLKAERHFGYYATYVSFFPQLVAGPIERPNNLLPQLRQERFFDYKMATFGMKLMAWGFFKKIVIADNLAFFVDKIYNNLNCYEGFTLILVAFFFSIEIYCDFSGYSDIAKGSAALLNIKLIDNFKSPYFSTTIKEFWSRWHISLSTWFRDYVYIPMGGNRVSKAKHYLNIFITFIVSGLWHGANITFVIWGAINGLLQIIEDILHIRKETDLYSARWFFRVCTTFILMTFIWVFFRSQSVEDAIYVFSHMFVGINHPYNYFLSGILSFGYSLSYMVIHLMIYLVPLIIVDLFLLKKDIIEWLDKKPAFTRYVIYYILIISILIFRYIGEVNFIYFQF